MKKNKRSRVESRETIDYPQTRISRRGLPRWLLLIVVVALATAGTWSLFEFVVWAKLPANIVGKWVVEGGEQNGATFDFYRNGKMIGRINVKGKEGIINARVRIDGKKLYTTTRNPFSGENETRVQTIQSLTARELVLEDDRGKALRMKRAE